MTNYSLRSVLRRPPQGNREQLLLFFRLRTRRGKSTVGLPGVIACSLHRLAIGVELALVVDGIAGDFEIPSDLVTLDGAMQRRLAQRSRVSAAQFVAVLFQNKTRRPSLAASEIHGGVPGAGYVGGEGNGRQEEYRA